jgi:beta-phosphoglucomutase
MPLRAVLFDFDGVLVDSEPLHFRSLRDCLLPVGVVIDEIMYAERYIPYSDREAIRLALEDHGRPAEPERVHELALAKARRFQSLIPEIGLFPGARELVGTLAEAVPLAIASGALRAEIESILRASGLLERFVAIIGADDVQHGKPHPEPFLTAMLAVARATSETQGLRPEECLVFEDSVGGIAAALAAGMRVVGVAHSFTPAKLRGAHRVVESLVGLELSELRRLFESESHAFTLPGS